MNALALSFASVCLAACAGSDESEVMSSPWWSVGLSGGRMSSLRYDPAGAGAYGGELVFRPLAFRCDERTMPLTPSSVELSTDDRSLSICVPGCERFVVDWAIDLSTEGYYDRLSGTTYRSGQDESPALTRFVAGATGHTVVVEAFKRLSPEAIRSVGYLHPANGSGRTLIVRTADGGEFVLDYGVGGSVRFDVVEDRLCAKVTVSGGRLTLIPYHSSGPLVLETGERLPHFTFGRDLAVTNSVGGEASLNVILNDFFMQTAFWWHCPTGISYHGEWGPMGHSYMDCWYREGVRKALADQVVADDGYGRDGLAYIWGDNRGWPFPDQKLYDTRHLSANAIHICGIRHYLMWTGEYDRVAGRDYSIRGMRQGEVVFAQDEQDSSVCLSGDLVLTQRFVSPASFDSIGLNLTIPEQHPVHSREGVTEYEAPLQGGQYTSLIVADAPGSAVGQVIRPSRPFNVVGIVTATWASSGNGGRLRAFEWVGDYGSSVGQAPLFEHQVTEVRDNEPAYLPMPSVMPAGTEVLIVLDEPTQAEPGKPSKTTCWFTEARLSDEMGACFAGGEEVVGRRLRVLYGMRHRPGAQVTLLNAAGEAVLAEEMEFPVIDGYFDIALGRELPAGEYKIELIPSGARMHWKSSAHRTDFQGEALINGHTWDWLDRARRMMDYQMEYLHGREDGVLRIDESCGDKDHLGLSDICVGNNYYDIIPFGYYDAYAGACFYRSLEAMADLERAYGDPERASYYEGFMHRVRNRYNELYWTENGHQDGGQRYIGCIDVNGRKRDYGFTVLNTMAVASGLAPEDRAEAIIDWLDNGKTLDADGQWKHDIYEFAFAPRFSTINNPDWWAVGWNVGLCPWGDQIQNGGADLYESYYDIIARLMTRGADDAYKRLLAILTRYSEPDRLTGGRPLFMGESVQGGWAGGPGGVGVMTSEFPETALLAAVMVYGFVGAEARADGLHLKPRVPSDQPFIRAENIYYHGASFDIEASAESIRLRANPVESRFSFEIDGVLRHPPFECECSMANRCEVVIVPVATQNKQGGE